MKAKKPMASERITLYLVPWLVLLGAAALGFSASQPKGALIATSTAQPTSSPVAASPEASATRPSPTPVIDWSEPPACQNQPQDLASWREELADRTESEATAGRFQAHLNQLRRYTPLLRDVSLGELSDILATPNSASAEDLHQRTLTVLWLNVISGRLNRATEITPPPAYTSKTVAELINELEQAQSGSAGFDQLLALADQVNSGHHLSRHVCARLLYRHGSVVEEAIWSDQGFVDLKYSLTNVPRGVTTFSPDNTQLVIETPRGDSGGGPIYLLDLQTAQLLNLNEHVGLPDYTGVCSLKVSGWHFDNRHVLLVNEDDEINIWLDLETGEYTPLALDVDTNHKSLPREFTLSPEGTGLAFTTFSDDAKHTHLHWYSLDDHSTSLMATLPITRGRLTAFSFSPTSQQAAYLVSLGKRSEGHHEELHLLDLNDTDSRALLSGYLGHIQPIWSPDGAQIAFTRRSHDKPRHAGPHVAPDYGDVWTISTSTGEAQQLTFIDAIKHPPVWSPDGQYLAFVTAAGQIGLVSVDQPGQIWRVETGSLTDPQFTELAFIP